MQIRLKTAEYPFKTIKSTVVDHPSINLRETQNSINNSIEDME